MRARVRMKVRMRVRMRVGEGDRVRVGWRGGGQDFPSGHGLSPGPNPTLPSAVDLAPAVDLTLAAERPHPHPPQLTCCPPTPSSADQL